MEEVVTTSKAPPMEDAVTGAKRRVSVRIDRIAYRSAAPDKDQAKGVG